MTVCAWTHNEAANGPEFKRLGKPAVISDDDESDEEDEKPAVEVTAIEQDIYVIVVGTEASVSVLSRRWPPSRSLVIAS